MSSKGRDEAIAWVDGRIGRASEARVPLLDHRVVEFAWRLPLSFKLQGDDRKWLLRKLLYRYGSAGAGGIARQGILIAAQEGVDMVAAEFPEAQIYVCQIDPELNDVKYIVPGLGDAGDRIFNTLG